MQVIKLTSKSFLLVEYDLYLSLLLLHFGLEAFNFLSLDIEVAFCTRGILMFPDKIV